MSEKRSIRRGSQTVRHYIILIALLYGRFKWMKRHVDGGITVPTQLFAKQVGVDGPKLSALLQKLYDIGLLTDYIVQHGYFYVKPAVPKGMSRLVVVKESSSPIGAELEEWMEDVWAVSHLISNDEELYGFSHDEERHSESEEADDRLRSVP
jgi:hypothetical protein